MEKCFMEKNLDNLKKIIKYSVEAFLIPIFLYKNNRLVTELSSDSLFNFQPVWNDLTSLTNQAKNSTGFICFDSHFSNVFYGILHIDQDYCCLLGPCCIQSLSHQETRNYYKTYNTVKITIPKLSESRMKSILFLLSHFFQIPLDSISSIETDGLSQSNEEINLYQKQLYQLDQSELGFIHHSYQYEQQMRQLIISGDESALLKMLAPEETYGAMSYNPVKQAEYAAIICISVLTRYAIEAGLEQFTAYDLSDLYIQKISRASSIRSYNQISRNALHHFMTEINKVKKSTDHLIYLKKAKQFISCNLNTPFKLDDLAKYVDLTPNYLSTVFSKYEQITIKEYILRERIHAAQNMLKYSDYTLSQISYYFCFCSQSHFSRTFKKYVGQTPAVYRKENTWV